MGVLVEVLFDVLGGRTGGDGDGDEAIPAR